MSRTLNLLVRLIGAFFVWLWTSFMLLVSSALLAVILVLIAVGVTSLLGYESVHTFALCAFICTTVVIWAVSELIVAIKVHRMHGEEQELKARERRRRGLL